MENGAKQIVRHRKQHAKRHKARKLTDELAHLITQLVRQYLSPEQISGYLKHHHTLSLSHETIYRFIYSDDTRKAELKPFLRQGGRHRRKRYGSGARASCIPNRISITERPPIRSVIFIRFIGPSRLSGIANSMRSDTRLASSRTNWLT